MITNISIAQKPTGGLLRWPTILDAYFSIHPKSNYQNFVFTLVLDVPKPVYLILFGLSLNKKHLFKTLKIISIFIAESM